MSTFGGPCKEDLTTPSTPEHAQTHGGREGRGWEGVGEDCLNPFLGTLDVLKVFLLCLPPDIQLVVKKKKRRAFLLLQRRGDGLGRPAPQSPSPC